MVIGYYKVRQASNKVAFGGENYVVFFLLTECCMLTPYIDVTNGFNLPQVDI